MKKRELKLLLQEAEEENRYLKNQVHQKITDLTIMGLELTGKKEVIDNLLKANIDEQQEYVNMYEKFMHRGNRIHEDGILIANLEEKLKEANEELEALTIQVMGYMERNHEI